VAPGSDPIIGFVVSDIKDSIAARAVDAIAMAFKSKVEKALGKKLESAPDGIGPLNNIREDRSFTHGSTTVTLASGSRSAIEQNRDKMKSRTIE
jgi:hypothetical protein